MRGKRKNIPSIRETDAKTVEMSNIHKNTAIYLHDATTDFDTDCVTCILTADCDTDCDTM